MKHTKEEINQACSNLLLLKNSKVFVVLENVSKSRMTRYAKFYVLSYNNLINITYDMSIALNYAYKNDDLTIKISGCGMDMLFHTLSSLNYKLAVFEQKKTITEILKEGKFGNIYSNYCFDAENYRLL